MTALRRVDPEKGDLATYAAHWIRHEFNACLAHLDREIYYPRSFVKPISAIRADDAVRSREGRPANAAEMGVSEQKLADWDTAAGVSMSLNRRDTVEDGGIAIKDDGPTGEDALQACQSGVVLEQLMGLLDPMEHAVITILFLEEKGILRASAEMHKSPNTVSALRDSAIAKMRAAAEDYA
jgi:DNA-directed RNA polymerase specialized sigma subunit